MEHLIVIDTFENGKPPASVLKQEASLSDHPHALESLRGIFRALNQLNIRYCHWKSNIRLDVALQGETDLDLLVDRRQSQVFREILAAYGIKSVLAPPGKRYPGLEDYIGFDPAIGRLFHLHVHYHLVLGEQFVKNYRLPLEEHFLASARLQYGVNVPAPELELIVLSLRALLKYRDRDVVKDILTIRSPGIPAEIQQEVAWLMAQTTPERIAHRLATVDDIVPADVVTEFLETTAHAPRDGRRLFRLRTRTRRTLARYQRYGRATAMRIYAQELWRRRNTLLRFAPIPRMVSANGGVTLALIGADGAGKSTMSDTLIKWLNWKMDAHGYYLGSKQPSRHSAALYMIFRMARRSQRATARRLGEGHALSAGLARLRDNLLRMHHFSIGRDRYARFRVGRQQAMAGSIVIYDRYPLELISSRAEFRLLDGPQIDQTDDGAGSGIGRWLAHAEQQLYRRIELPEHLLVLDVSPDVSLQRKPDHDPVTVRTKIRAIRELVDRADSYKQCSNLIRLDADQPFEDVLHQLKGLVWERL